MSFFILSFSLYTCIPLFLVKLIEVLWYWWVSLYPHKVRGVSINWYSDISLIEFGCSPHFIETQCKSNHYSIIHDNIQTWKRPRNGQNIVRVHSRVPVDDHLHYPLLSCLFSRLVNNYLISKRIVKIVNYDWLHCFTLFADQQSKTQSKYLPSPKTKKWEKSSQFRNWNKKMFWTFCLKSEGRLNHHKWLPNVLSNI